MFEKFEKKGSFLTLNGRAQLLTKNYSNKKLCFVCTDKEFLMNLLVELSEHRDCFFVKLSAEPRDKMYLGRCFFTSDELIGEFWAKYKMNPKVLCNVQDDDFVNPFREQVKKYD